VGGATPGVGPGGGLGNGGRGDCKSVAARAGLGVRIPPHPPCEDCPVRRPIGIGLAVVTIVVTMVYVAGIWNPWRLVILTEYFGNPTAGVVWVLAGTLASVWLLHPVVGEAAQHGRLMLRFGLGAMLAVSLGCYGLLGAQFGGGEHSVLASSPDGQRKLILISRFDDRTLRIWSGSGLGLRDAGYLGIACG